MNAAMLEEQLDRAEMKARKHRLTDAQRERVRLASLALLSERDCQFLFHLASEVSYRLHLSIAQVEPEVHRLASAGAIAYRGERYCVP